MKLHIGSSTVRVEGFLNVDIRSVEGVDIVAHAGRLTGISTATVDVIFANAFIEHVFVGQQLAVLREWKRVLAPNGVLIMLGIPDFRVIAELYVSGAPGVMGERFDLYNVYRYTHGDPEQNGTTAAPETWARWDPGAVPNGAPRGWLPQLHKSLYDPTYLQELLNAAGMHAVTFNYAWGDEVPLLNLGVIAAPTEEALRHRVESPIEALQQLVPGIERFLRLSSVAIGSARAEAARDTLLDLAVRLDADQAPSAARRASARRSPLRRLLARLRG
jgi:SAM-dependent methyltransferase